jgi:hypothetical protein
MAPEAEPGTALRGRAATLTSPAALVCAAALILSLLPATSAIRDPDFWWHLRTGQLILDSHALVATDPFTYTATGHHWVMHEWLTEVTFAGLYRLGGLGLIVAVLCVVTWVGLVALAWRAGLPIPAWASARAGREAATPRRRVSFVVLGLGMVLASIAGYPIWGPRAQMETFALTCVTLLLMERHLRLGGRAIWVLVPIFLVWSNLHSGFIIGAGFLVLVAAVELAGHRLGMPGIAPLQRTLTLVKVIAACAVVVVVNPNGPGIYLYPFETQGSAAQQSLILEWHSPDFHDTAVRAFGVMLLSLAVMCVVTRRVRPRDAALALATTALALQSVRHIALFVAATTPLWIEQADMSLSRARDWWRARPGIPTARARPARAPRTATRPAQPPLWFRGSVVALVVGVPLAFLGARMATAVSTQEDSLFYAKDFPVCATRWLEAAPASLHLNIFNQYGEGGYLALHLTPRGDRVFIFGDAALMGDDLLHQYGSVEGLGATWETVVDGSNTDIVLFDNSTPLVEVLSASPDWRQVYHDGHNTAFVHADAAGAALAAQLPPQPAFTTAGDTCTLLADTQTTAAQTAKASR